MKNLGVTSVMKGSVISRRKLFSGKKKKKSIIPSGVPHVAGKDNSVLSSVYEAGNRVTD